MTESNVIVSPPGVYPPVTLEAGLAGEIERVGVSKTHSIASTLIEAGVAALSSGDVEAMLNAYGDLRRFSGLPWHCICTTNSA